MSIVINILLVIHVLVSLLIILFTLMQRPKNEGLGAAFGGGMTENLFGAQTTNVLQTITRWLCGIFFVLTLGLSYLYVQKTRAGGSVREKLSAPTVVPAAAPTPGAAAAPAVGKAPEAGPEAKPADAQAEAPKTEASAKSETPAPAEAKPAEPAAPAPAK